MRDEMLDSNLPGTMPRRRRRRFHHCELPVELYSEIIGYLWNDIPSLMACSLANRIMTVPSQKHLFNCIALRPPLQKLRNEHEFFFTNGLCGTSHNFWKLLLGSPHIAKYVVSLHIVDHRNHYKSPLEVPAPIAGSTVDDDGLGYKLENGQDVDLDAPLAPNVYAANFKSLDGCLKTGSFRFASLSFTI